MTDKEDDITLIFHGKTIGEERVLLFGNVVNSVRDGQILVPVVSPSGNSIEFLPSQLAKVQYDLFEGARVHLCSESVEQSKKENWIKKLAQVIQTDHLNHEERASLWEEISRNIRTYSTSKEMLSLSLQQSNMTSRRKREQLQ